MIPNIYNKILSVIYEHFNYDLSYVTIKLLDKCIYNNGQLNHERNPIECAGCWTKHSIIYIGSVTHLKKVMLYYHINNMSLLDFKISVLAHEFGHEIYNKKLTFDEKSKYNESLKDLSSVYIEHIKNKSCILLDEEKFAEYVSTVVLNGM